MLDFNFTGLPSGWRVVKFGDITRISSGQVSPLELKYANFPYLGPENIESDTGRIINVQTSSELGLTSGKYVFDAESVVYSKIRPNLNKVCIPNFAGLCSADAYPIWPRAEMIEKEYLFVFMRSSIFLQQSISCSMRTGMPKINRDDLNSIEVILPTIKEQRLISRKIICWDRAIENLEQLIATKTEFKRGLIQRLLTGRIRFKEFEGQEWKLMKLSDFLKLSLRLTPKPGKPFKSLGIRSHGKGTFLKEDFEPERIELTELYEVKENDLIVNITFAWEGAIAIAGAADSGALVSHRFPTYVFDTERAIPEYFRHVIVQKRFVEKLGLISPGGAGRNRVLSKKDFANLEVLMPSVEEQRKIAAVLNACDRELDLLREQLVEFKMQKEGLMQKLLTGQIRVKVDEAQAIGV